MSNLHPIKPGEPIRAPLLNKLIDGAKIALDSQKSGAGKFSAAHLSNTTVEAHVVSDRPLPVYAVVSIEGSMYDPATHRNEFLETAAIRVGRPHAGTQNFAILQRSVEVPNQIVPACVSGISIVELYVTSPEHEFAVPNEEYTMTTAESGVARIVWKQEMPGPDGKIWGLVSYPVGGGGTAEPSNEPAVIVEPVRRPLFRNRTPAPFAEENTPEGNAARCMGTIKLPGKTYSPIRAINALGIPMLDDFGNTLYLKAREPRTGSGRFVLRWNGKTSEPVEWIFADGTLFPNTTLHNVADRDFFDARDFFLIGANMVRVTPNWGLPDYSGLTINPEEAQLNYDYAVCYNLDWSELLIEGDKVEYQQRTTNINIPKAPYQLAAEEEAINTEMNSIRLARIDVIQAELEESEWAAAIAAMEAELEMERLARIMEIVPFITVAFTYYEVTPIEKFITPVEGQADVEVYTVEPQWVNAQRTGNPVTWQWYEVYEVDVPRPELPEDIIFGAVYLKLKDDRCTPKLKKAVGICNDCTALRVRGCFIRKDIKGRKYPMLFELANLRAGGAVRTRNVLCYNKIENDECAPVGHQPEMELVRLNEWRLSLSPNVCAISCSALVEPIITDNGGT